MCGVCGGTAAPADGLCSALMDVAKPESDGMRGTAEPVHKGPRDGESELSERSERKKGNGEAG